MIEAAQVSVIVPVRNGRRYIGEAIASALAQGRLVGEVIVVNDRSTDDTAAVVATIADPRVRLVDSPEAGVSAARNHGIGLARGAWISCLDSDDRMRPGGYARLLAAWSPGVVAMYGDYDRIDEAGQRIGLRHMIRSRAKPSGNIVAALLSANFIAVGSILMRREALLAIGGFAKGVALCEDWLLWCRLATQGDIAYLAGIHVSDYRIHGESAMHRKALTFAIMAPILDLMFGDPLVQAHLDQAVRDECRRRAEASLRSYIATEAVRLRDWRVLAQEVLDMVRLAPGGLPKVTLRLAATMAGL